MLLTRSTADLEDVDEIGGVVNVDGEADGNEIEVLEAEAVVELVVREQLLAPQMDRVLRQVERIAQRDVAGSEFDLVREGLLRARAQHDRSMAVDAQFHVAEETRVVMEEADVRSAS